MDDYNHQEFVPHNARFSFDSKPYHWYRLRGVVDKRDEEGRPILVIGSAEDIEKQMQIEKNLIESKEKAIESNKLKSTFIANMSHEIRTPLNAIIGFSDLIATKDNLKQAEKETFRKYIEKNKNLLMQLFNDILDSSKIDAGTIEFNYEREDFSDIIKGLISSSKIRLEKNDKVKFIIDPMPESCIFYFDSQRVSQVINNFINNAFKFTASGSVTIGYKIENNDNIYCYVSDTGTGIPKDKLPKVFERFVKLDSFKQGTGLGLAISKVIIEKMHGEIGVESEENKGSTFWFRLPILAEVPDIKE